MGELLQELQQTIMRWKIIIFIIILHSYLSQSSCDQNLIIMIIINHHLISVSSMQTAGEHFLLCLRVFLAFQVTYRFYLDISEWLADLIAFLCLVCVSVYFFFTVFIMAGPCWPTVHTVCSCVTQELEKSWQIQRPRKTLASDIFFFGAQII